MASENLSTAFLVPPFSSHLVTCLLALFSNHPKEISASITSIASNLQFKVEMASLSESWIWEYNEASKLADNIDCMVSEANSLPRGGAQMQRHFSASRRKITILKTKLDTLESLLSKLPSRQKITAKEMNKRKDMLTNMRSKVNEMATTLNMSDSTNRDSLLGTESKLDDVMGRATNMDSHGLLSFQRQMMKEQDDGLAKLEETVTSTKHIALAVNEELNLHTRLLDSLDDHMESTSSRLQRVQRSLAILTKRTKGGCGCLCLLVIVIVLLAAVIWALIKWL
ncbi:hypothetical protein Nepgr_020489 [Nepenthes gracilis]|uniref:t-SNARE coiled-coil homology domain-containing protein n=1 Tax=Nepenthes gracilis TaxID=150966 RepID=A0AAD3SV60_NEPGR|nr:hypothetical protein Nepgr_020489 [Nepenthes gracilis]